MLYPPDPRLHVTARHDAGRRALRVIIENHGDQDATVVIRANAYRTDASTTIVVKRGARQERSIALLKHHNWYDYTVRSEGFTRRFAGRIETGAHDVSDPA